MTDRICKGGVHDQFLGRDGQGGGCGEKDSRGKSGGVGKKGGVSKKGGGLVLREDKNREAQGDGRF